MPNIFDENGLQIETRQETYDRLVARMRAVYGPDINVASDTPDGQFLNIMVQDEQDLLELVAMVNSSFDPDEATGVILDERVAINGIERFDGSYTIQNVQVSTAQILTLYGLDQFEQPVYTVADNTNTRWLLASTQTDLPIGDNLLVFRAEKPGQVLSIPNTITVPVTVVLGVTAVTNPTTYTLLGENEESDVALKVRRRQSVSIGGRGWLDSLRAALANLVGMVSSSVFENHADDIVDGIPAHGIWVVVEGSASDTQIANAIYDYKAPGCDIRGQIDFVVTRPAATPTIIKWDIAEVENVFIFFTPVSIEGDETPNLTEIAEYLAANIKYRANEKANMTAIGTAMQALNSDLAFGNPGTSSLELQVDGLSTGTVQYIQTSGLPASGTFKFTYGAFTTAAIPYTFVGAETALRALPGLSLADLSVTDVGSYLIIDIQPNDPAGVAAMIGVKDNAVFTSGPSLVRFFHPNETVLSGALIGQPVVSPTSLTRKFVVAAANVIMPLQVFPSGVTTVGIGEEIQFVSAGGYGEKFWDVYYNETGGTISSTGLYTAGGTPGEDYIEVFDVFGMRTAAYVTVV
jgi:uncharacterized phage protein gp47/JayE